MLATICDDTWNVLNIQHITPNLNRWDYQDTPGGGHKKIKGPAHMVEGGHHLRKAPNPHPHPLCDDGPSIQTTPGMTHIGWLIGFVIFNTDRPYMTAI